MSRILLIDDDPCVLLLFEGALLDAGYQVDTADTFKGADRLLSSYKYDALVTDGVLPDGPGTMLANKATERGIPAVLMTGYLDGLSQTNFSAYVALQKPVRPDQLMEIIEAALADRLPAPCQF